MYELIIDTDTTEKTIICSSYEELDSAILDLPEGAYWQIRSTNDLSFQRQGFVI